MGSSSRARGVGFPASAQLPIYLTPLIGRSREVEEVGGLLRTGRLVSLVGAGGSGKTRLAAATAAALRPGHTGGVAWIDLTPLSDPALVAQHAAETLGIRETPGRSAADSLVELIGENPVLLVLDNCEHLVGACALLVDSLLRGCPALRVLVTSRQALGIVGEKAWLVPPLALPAPGEDVSDSAAVQLFVERASDVLPSFQLTEANAPSVVRICRRLDGLPLAIELAAARVKLLPPAQLADRLDSTLNLLSSTSQLAVPRHRTLRALIDWSFGLLTSDERRLLGRLAVFAGGFTLESAERVAGDGALPAERVLDLLAGLVDKSLITTREWNGEARFGLLETVREYAGDRLRESGEADLLRSRHAAYFLELAEAAEPHILGGTRGTSWMERLEQEHGNLRAAMEWCGERDDRAGLALRLGAALHWFHFALGQFAEPRRRIQDALHRAGDLPPRLRGRALATLGYIALWTGDHEAILAPLAQAVDLLRGGDHPTDLAFALTGLATAAGMGGDASSAYRLFDEARAVLGEPGALESHDYPRALLYAFASYWRGSVALSQGDLPLARSGYETAVGVARAWGSHPTIAHPLAALARVLIAQGELDEAEACLAESVPIHTGNDDRWGLIQAVEVGALLAASRGRMESAARLLGTADRLRAQVGVAPAPHERLERTRLVEAVSAALGAEGFGGAHADGWEMPASRSLAEITGTPAEQGPGSGEARAASPPPPPASVAAAVGPLDLRVRSLGALQIFLGDSPLEGEAFGSSKPRELLLFLLCHPEGSTREQVGLAFWPESSAAQVKNSFHVTLHRLRKALEHPEWILTSGERYRLDPALRIDFDALRFEAEIESALRHPLPDADREQRLVAALALYAGEFLEGEPVGDWHLEIRDRLRRLHTDGLLALGGLRMAANRFAEAADAFGLLLARDRLHEEACRQLMLCHARSGERVQALRLYENLTLLLRDELDAEPDVVTTQLFHRLQSAEVL